MRLADFERLDASEQGRVFERALGRFVERRCRFPLVCRAGSLDFGMGLSTPSGVRHEVDLVASSGSTLYAFEAKHYHAGEVTKDMLCVFNQKTLDFYLELLRQGMPVSLKRVFVARTPVFGLKVREFAASWGMGLFGGADPDPIWLHQQLVRWQETRSREADLIEHTRRAARLAEASFRDLSDLLPLFSRSQASLRLDRLPGPEQCADLVREHDAVTRYWRDRRGAAVAATAG